MNIISKTAFLFKEMRIFLQYGIEDKQFFKFNFNYNDQYFDFYFH